MYSCNRHSFKYIIKVLIVCILAVGITICASANNIETKSKSNSAIYTQNEIASSGYMEANSNRQVHTFSTHPVSSSFTTDHFEKICETDEIELWINRKSGAFRILNKHSRYLWGALPLDNAEGLNSTWNSYGNSLVAIECFDDKGKEKRVSIAKDGKTEYTINENEVICKIQFKQYGISFSVKAELKNNCLNMSLVDGTLQEGIGKSKYKLKSLTFMPFLGTSYSDSIDGYMLIPDGSGALIRFRQPSNYSSTYDARIYGSDFGIEGLSSVTSEYAKKEPQVMMPIYGMVHGAGQNGYLAVIDSGDEYCSIVSTPALTNNPYNWTAARFEYRQSYFMSINRKDGSGAVVPQEHMNNVQPSVSFYFLEGDKANYDGMATFYRSILEQQGLLPCGNEKKPSMPLQLEVLGADKKQNFIGKSTTLFTSVEQAEIIANELSIENISNLSMVYKCYTKNNEGGASLLSKVGNRQDFMSLEQSLEKMGGNLYYYLDPTTANEDQITLRTEGANNLSNMAISYKRGTSQMKLMYPEVYLYRLSKTKQIVEKAMERSDYGNNFAIDQLSYKLYGDFTSGKERTRDQNLEQVVNIAEKMTEKEKLPMYNPNQYLWKYANEMYDLPLTNSQMLYESDSVPFLQIVLSGSVDMFASSMNTTSNSIERILRHIEYGMSPSYVVTGCESIQLYLTSQEEYSTTCFKDWKDQIVEDYGIINEALSSVLGSRIVKHKAILDGLIKVTYENGVIIYINYTDKSQAVDGVVVEANWYKEVK